MRKFVTLFTDSCREFKSIRTITVTAMLGALSIVLGMFSIQFGSSVRIGFSSIPNGVASYLFGPVVGGVFSGAMDVLKYLVKPTGAFFPPLTLVAILGGILYGCMYYKREITFARVLTAKFIVMIICNIILNTLCLSMLLGEGFFVLLPARVLKNLIMWPIDSVIFYVVAKSLERIGAFRLIRRPV